MNSESVALTRAELDLLHCNHAGCTHESHDGPLYFVGRCHMDSPVLTSYEDGKITIQCATCDTFICAIEVAS